MKIVGKDLLDPQNYVMLEWAIIIVFRMNCQKVVNSECWKGYDVRIMFGMHCWNVD